MTTNSGQIRGITTASAAGSTVASRHRLDFHDRVELQ